ncbi:MAG: 7-cyano-7-deazaguanine synthase QueC [Candidatus Thermoplasmatota archaeon]|nr:7-cyano-7-deazaguanine synthase QueC [Candidatus Thermoplasmatota archaeon]
MSKAVVLLSGGLDSTVTAAKAKADGHEIVCLTVQYGQRHERELESARAVAQELDALEHIVLDVDLSAFGGSALTDEGIEVPLDRDEGEMSQDIPVTYVPARNTVFLSLALSLAEAREADHLYIGANAVDYSGYPDCRPVFLDAFEQVANLGTKRGVEHMSFRIHAPLLQLTKAEIVEMGQEVQAPLSLTWSCYEGGKQQCGRCDACQLRKKGFAEAGVEDPVGYAV